MRYAEICCTYSYLLKTGTFLPFSVALSQRLSLWNIFSSTHFVPLSYAAYLSSSFHAFLSLALFIFFNPSLHIFILLTNNKISQRAILSWEHIQPNNFFVTLQVNANYRRLKGLMTFTPVNRQLTVGFAVIILNTVVMSTGTEEADNAC